ncbi:MAG: hypothetical protein C0593_11000 [Marinilabiliales bacterium]|nr:MAG: hypothetical protein C0593_11000 [Marinilabiliales bacterium]
MTPNKDQNSVNFQVNDDQFRHLLETINALVCIIRDGKVVYVNQTLSDRTFYSKEEIIGQDFTKFFPEEEASLLYERYQKRMEGDSVAKNYTVKALTAKGDYMYVNLDIQPYKYYGEKAILAFMTDVTHQVKIEEDLKKSEEMFRNLVENQGEGMGISDLDDVFIFANPEAHRIFGVKSGELIGRSLFDFLDDNGKEIIALENAKRNKGEVSSYTLSIFTPEGIEKRLIITATPQLDSEGRQISTLGIFRDMTMEQKALAKLEENRELLEAVIFGADAGIWEWDYPTNHLTVNERFYDIVGHRFSENDQITLRMMQRLMHPEDKLENMKLVTDHLRGKVNHLQLQFRLKKRSGDYTWLQVRGRITKWEESGKPKKISGTIVDINELKSSRIELEHRINMERLLSEVSRTLVNVTIDSFEDEIHKSLQRIGEFLKLNRVGLYQFRKNNSVLSNSHEWNMIPGESFQKEHITVEDFQWWVKAILEKEYILITHLDDLPVDAINERLTFEARELDNMLAVPLKYESKILGFLSLESKSKKTKWTDDDIRAIKVIAFNISNALEARIKHQTLIHSKDKAEESDRIKTAFLATMNHELRTPLNHILGISEIIKASTSEEDVLEYADMIHDSGENLLNMIEDVFHIADIEKGVVAIREQTFRGMEFFLENKASLEKQLKLSGKEKMISLTFKPEKSLLVSYITADMVKINLVLHKLFNNAVKYTQEGNIEFGFENVGEKQLRLWVKDTGIGIPKEQHKKIFDLFRQGDDGFYRKYGGIGAGLAITAKVVKAMKGRIFVESTLEKGSTFYVIIPVGLEIVRMR